MSNPKVIRFEPHGPADTGLAEWDMIDPGDLEAGNPVQRGHIYHQDAALGHPPTQSKRQSRDATAAWTVSWESGV